MTFKLKHKVTNKSVATFHILNAAGDIVGSVGVAPGQVSDLLRHWNGPVDRGGEQREPSVKAPLAKKMSTERTRKAVLRGC
jgi:hypothetical protein